jgi:hypothetical protein
MSPDDTHQLVQALINLINLMGPVIGGIGGYLASHYGNKQGAANASAAVEPKP